MAKWYEGAEESAEIGRSVKRYPNGMPRRDIVAVDGQKIVLGDAAVTLGHTATASMFFQVRDSGRRLLVASSGRDDTAVDRHMTDTGAGCDFRLGF
jgi:hypothetical protein